MNRAVDLPRRSFLEEHRGDQCLQTRGHHRFRGLHRGGVSVRVREQPRSVPAQGRPVWGDTLPPPEKRLLEERYGITVLSAFQACEALNIAFQCEEGKGFHISLDQVAVRVVDSDGRDVVPGVSGNLVISNLTNRATVLLNYRLGDRVTLGTGPCPCGRTLPMIETLDGRSEDLILRPGGELAHESVILSQLYDAPGLLLLQLEQLAMQEFVLRVVSRRDVEWTETERYLDRTLRAVLGDVDTLSLTIERVDDIPLEPSGKFKAIRSACTG